jgi:hypothetical protein
MIKSQWVLFNITLLVKVGYIIAGYQHRSLGNVIDAIKTCYKAFSSLKMLEFGNQEFHDFHSYSDYPLFRRYHYDNHQNLSAKSFFTHLGIDHTSIDINGRDGAIAFDVRKEIGDLFAFKQFDIITNLGFSEHVGEGDIEENFMKNQYMIFKNIHDAGGRNSLYFHDVPAISSFYQHGVAHYNTSFFKSMASIQKYDLIYLFMTDYGSDASKTIVASYTKPENTSFMTFEEFSSLPGIQSIYSDYRFVNISLEFTGERQSAHYTVQVDTESTSPIQAAIYFCAQYIDALKNLGHFDMNVCEQEVSRLIEGRLIQKSIR